MRFLFILLISCNTVLAQLILPSKDSAFIKLISDLPSKEPFDTTQKYVKKINSPYLYLISTKELYELFGWRNSSHYSAFDFDTYHIVGSQVCKQCQLYCHHDEGQTSCHRNVCNKEWIWAMRKNKKAFTEVPSKRKIKLTDELAAATKFLYGDTIFRAAADNKATWVTSSGGDCHASIKFGLFADNYYPVLLLKEWNYYGGCRAGGNWEFAIDFRMPPGITENVKAVVFMGKRDWED